MTATVSFIKRIKGGFQHAWETKRPGRLAWQGAGLGLLVAAVSFLLIAAYQVFLAPPRIASFLLASAQFLAIAAAAGALLVLLVALLKRIPAFYGWALVLTLVLLYLSFFKTALASQMGMLLFLLAVIVVASLLGAGVWVLARGGWRKATSIQRAITDLGLVLGLGGLAAGAYWLLDAGQTVETPPNAAALSSAHVTPIQMPDPSQPGT